MIRRLMVWGCLLLLLVACEGQLGPSTSPPVIGGVDLSDPDVGGGIGLVEEPVATPLRPKATLDTSPRLIDSTPPGSPLPTVPPVSSETAEPPTPEQVTQEPAPTLAPTPTERPPAENAESVPLQDEEIVPEAPVEVDTRPATHIVAAGETLNKIAQLYGLTWPDLAAFNGLTNADQIQTGLELRVPPLEGAGEEGDTPEDAETGPIEEEVAVTEEPPSEPTPGSEEATRSPQTETTHTVRPGENLFRISRIYDVNWALIAEANGLVAPNQIYVGQVLKIPVTIPGPTPEFTHRVQAGETAFRIALQYGIPLPSLVEANGLQAPYVIYPGQELLIPAQTDP